jgi:hypothetical protein
MIRNRRTKVRGSMTWCAVFQVVVADADGEVLK